MLAAALLGALALGSCGVPVGGEPTPTPYVIILTATPLGQDTPEGGSSLTPAPTSTTDPATAPPTPLPDSTDGAAFADATATAKAPPSGENTLANPGFEGPTEFFGDNTLELYRGWEPFYCARPLVANCYSSRSGEDLENPAGLRMVRPSYGETRDDNRVHGGDSAQRWRCPYGSCRAGVMQRFDTQPGQVCTAGAWVQAWSSGEDTGINPLGEGTGPWTSQLRTDDDQRNAVWYVRVDPEGRDNPWAGQVQVSRPYTYADGIYDQYVRISLTFVATGERATLFVENTRLWPFKHNESFVDDAFVTCAAPDPAALPINARKRVEVGDFTPVVDGPLPWKGKELGDFVRVGEEIWAYLGNDRGNVEVILRTVSQDGLTWSEPEEVFENAPGEAAWDAGLVYNPSVLYDPDTGKFQMWYLGKSKNSSLYTRGIGYAVSDDGIRWERVGNGPIATSGPAGAWNEERIDGPEVIEVDGRYILYVSGSQLQPDLIRQIGCWLGTDGAHWTLCEPNPILAPLPNQYPFEGLEAEQPNVVVHDGVYLMAYTGYLGPQGNRWGIGLAVSGDGLNWQRLPGNPIVSLDDRKTSTTDPVLLLDAEKGVVYLYYRQAGDSGDFRVLSAPIKFKN
jgi:predicted GH43/DUF377 family glycosyl hydrolase